MMFPVVTKYVVITGLAVGCLFLTFIVYPSSFNRNPLPSCVSPELTHSEIKYYKTCNYTRANILTHLYDFREALNNWTSSQSLKIKLDDIIHMVKCEDANNSKKHIDFHSTRSKREKEFLSSSTTLQTEYQNKTSIGVTKFFGSTSKEADTFLRINYSTQHTEFSNYSTERTELTSRTPTTDIDQKTEDTVEVCPETWKGIIDHPFFFTAWKTGNCSNVLPFHTVLSIVLYPFANNSRTCLQLISEVLTGLNGSYPKVPVLVANVNDFCKDVNVSSQIKILTFNDTVDQPGQIWNALAKAVATRYVLVGRGIDSFMWLPNLERPVRVISHENNTVQIVGGAVRNITGHWRIGCHQSSMRNYILEYQEGYYKSKNECMFCDYLAGPFVARVDLLEQFPFDDSLPEHILFEDFFLRIKQASYSVVNCPDLMYFATDAAIEKKLSDRSFWFPLVHKWGLNRVVVPGGHVFAYSCDESGITCKGIYSLTQSFLIPICCIEQFANAAAFVDKFCRLHDLRYELEAGSILGIVKISDLMPWDLDGDLTYLMTNHSFYVNHVKEFNKHNLKLDKIQTKENSSYFKLYTPNLYIEMIGELILSNDDPRARMFREVPTQALFHGKWVYVQPSPGLYSRNRYGHEMLRHTHSWLQLGMKGWAPYKSGYFKKCKRPKHHACLDQFSTDGNLQFYVPN